jgi:hypothetical protein
MRVEADVRVSDIMEALEMESPPEGYSRGDDVEITVTVDDDDMEDKFTPDPVVTLLSDLIDKGAVFDLSAAIRRGDKAEAELLMDRIFGDDTDTKEWVQQGRYSHKARQDKKTLRQAIEESLAA